MLEVKTIRTEISELRTLLEKIQAELPTPVRKTAMPEIQGLYQYKI